MPNRKSTSAEQAAQGELGKRSNKWVDVDWRMTGGDHLKAGQKSKGQRNGKSTKTANGR